MKVFHLYIFTARAKIQDMQASVCRSNLATVMAGSATENTIFNHNAVQIVLPSADPEIAERDN